MAKRNPYVAKTGLRGDSVRDVCAAASLRVYDPFFDDHWSFRPANRRPRKRVVREVDMARLVAHLLR